MSEAEGLAPEDAERMAGEVLKHLLGSAPERLVPLTGGLSNAVFEACRPEGDLVVRIAADTGRIGSFLKEQWVIARVAEEGVPVPEVLEVGIEPIGLPYMVARKVAGQPGTHHKERFCILREVGRLARRIHRVPTEGFGHSFDWSGNQLSKKLTWEDYLAREFRCRERLAVLERHGMLTSRATDVLHRTLEEVEAWRPDARLNHGDLRLKNVIAGADGDVIAVIDWEECTGNAAPHWDLAVALHDLSVDAKEEFIAGYGLSPREMLDLAPALRLLNMLHYATAVERSAEEEDRAALERLRARLQGGLDLYTF